eukprot:COSAG02_NODE_26177_length_639_cov_0.722222_2_plen_47_part_01
MRGASHVNVLRVRVALEMTAAAGKLDRTRNDPHASAMAGEHYGMNCV